MDLKIQLTILTILIMVTIFLAYLLYEYTFKLSIIQKAKQLCEKKCEEDDVPLLLKDFDVNFTSMTATCECLWIEYPEVTLKRIVNLTSQKSF